MSKPAVLRQFAVAAFFVSAALSVPASAWAHGFAGNRFFPTTFAVDDPFISDEFSLLYNYIRTPEARTNEVDLGVSKRILPDFGVELDESFQHLHFKDGGSASGFSNLGIGLKYQFLTSAEHETILSVGLGAELGGTGDHNIGADPFSTISPAFFFGKGMGDLPDSMGFLRPVAVTGVVGPNFPTGDAPDSLTWAFTLQYSLIYLQSCVKDVGLPDPLKRMVVVVEFPMQTDLDGHTHGQTTGTVNPGIVWCGKYLELGVAAQIPINDRTGNSAGVFGLVHLFIDDLFPNSIGRPVFQ